MNYSVIDIGANTMRLSIFAIHQNKPVLLFNKKQTSGLANYNENGALSEDGFNVLVTTLKKFNKLLSYYPVDQKYVFATASLRNVSNSKEVIAHVKENTGLEIDLLSDKKEANLGFLGISSAVKNLENGISVDIGGGSTEIVLFKDRKIQQIFNLDEGCLSLHKKFVKGIMPKKAELAKIRKYIQKRMKSFKPDQKVDLLTGIGGTIRSSGKILAELKVIENKRHFEINHVYELYELLLEKDPETLDAMMRVTPDRIHTMQTGLVIFMTICQIFGIKKIQVSTYGLREGYVLDKLKTGES